ncbi:MAG: rhodanese-like domain-containing protein [Gammaproteobacteria bacterium]|nr:rhodanese-like domain-containing protein [Gammaproteobacteria bacterium]
MNDLLPFLLAHWPLTLAFVITLGTLLFFELKDRQGGAQRIDCTEMTRLINHEKALVIDVRKKEEYQQGHIISALNITPENFKDQQAQLQKAKNRPIILIDSNGSGINPMLKLLQQEGLSACYLGGGLSAWRQEGLPVTTVIE